MYGFTVLPTCNFQFPYRTTAIADFGICLHTTSAMVTVAMVTVAMVAHKSNHLHLSSFKNTPGQTVNVKMLYRETMLMLVSNPCYARGFTRTPPKFFKDGYSEFPIIWTLIIHTRAFECRLRLPCFRYQRGKRHCGHWGSATGESKAAARTTFSKAITLFSMQYGI